MLLAANCTLIEIFPSLISPKPEVNVPSLPDTVYPVFATRVIALPLDDTRNFAALDTPFIVTLVTLYAISVCEVLSVRYGARPAISNVSIASAFAEGLVIDARTRVWYLLRPVCFLMSLCPMSILPALPLCGLISHCPLPTL